MRWGYLCAKHVDDGDEEGLEEANHGSADSDTVDTIRLVRHDERDCKRGDMGRSARRCSHGRYRCDHIDTARDASRE